MPLPARNPAARAIKAARGLALRAAATHLLPRDVMLLRGPSTRRRVALTFDDGPHELTPRYLDVLAKADVRATFFVVGNACVAHPDELAAIARAGHELAGHGFTHTEFPKLDGDALRAELAQTAALLPARANGEAPRRALVRPPRGVVTPRSLLRCFRAGYTSAMWSYDTLDWDARSAAEIIRKVNVHAVTPGEIVLMHEGRPFTLEALPALLARFRDAGFELCTIRDLMTG